MSNYMDFRQNDEHPLNIMASLTSAAMTNLVALRAHNYPLEKPIDGEMLTMSAVGIYGKPAKLTIARHVTLQCDSKNPRSADFGVLYRGMNVSTTSAGT